MHATLTKAEEALGMFFFALTSTLVFVGAVARTIGSPLIWSVDIAQAAFVWACVLGADVALKRGAHIEIDIFVRRFSVKARRVLAGASWTLIAIFLAYLVFYGIQLTRLNVERPLGDTGLSYVWVTLAIPVGAFLMLATTLRTLWRAWVGREAFSLEGRDGMVL